MSHRKPLAQICTSLHGTLTCEKRWRLARFPTRYATLIAWHLLRDLGATLRKPQQVRGGAWTFRFRFSASESTPLSTLEALNQQEG